MPVSFAVRARADFRPADVTNDNLCSYFQSPLDSRKNHSLTSKSSDDFGIVCPKCEKVNLVSEDVTGRSMRCPECNQSVDIARKPEPKSARAALSALPEEKRRTPNSTPTRLSEDRKPKLVRQETPTVEDYAEGQWARTRTAPAQFQQQGSGTPSKLNRGTIVLASLTALIALAAFWTLAGLSKRTGVRTEDKVAKNVAGESPPLHDPRDVAENFLSAHSHEERLKWVRSPELHLDRIREHFTSIGEPEAEVHQMRPILQHQIDDRIIAMFLVKFTSGRTRPLCVVEENNSRVIDWEAYARQGTASWDDLLAGRETSAEVRVFVHRPQAVPFGIGGNENQRALRLEMISPDCEQRLFGFIKRPSRTANVMVKALADTLKRAAPVRPQRMTLEIESRDGSHLKHKFLITRIVANGWVKSNDGDFESTCLVSSDGDMTVFEEFEKDVRRQAKKNRLQQQGQELLIK